MLLVATLEVRVDDGGAGGGHQNPDEQRFTHRAVRHDEPRSGEPEDDGESELDTTADHDDFPAFLQLV